MSDRSKPLTGLLWLRTGGLDLSLSLAGVQRVALGNQLRVAPAGPRVPPWWSGVAIADERAHPLLNMAELLGTTPHARRVGDAVVVLTAMGGQPVGLVCDRFRGIIPPGQADWALPGTLFTSAECAPSRARLWEGRLVLDFETERFFPARRRAQLEQAMKNSKENVDQLWELSELEQQLANAPTAKGYRNLADRYRKLGWLEDAERMLARAAEVKSDAPAARTTTTAGGLTGPLTPRVLLELLQVLHTTVKSGELLLDAPGAIAGSITLSRGEIIDARSADADDAAGTLRKLSAIKAGRYQFFPGAPTDAESKLPTDTAAVLAELSRQLSTP
ncbi:DUF4388 domain-containing protein [Opitutus sp. ER46]|uniref:DUF4388 domain-containing protein n=1 Tax=Opitutus sp. ER46 TaxID=2161864 RepID=UPI000D30AFFD|nr:DUF4388 domain-containing protein [Opitutus sp. ER46]PTX90711.1 hypothetical protein DB354_18790 [Opitutus sp. ER46]